MSEIKGYINMPFHGESAYEIAKRHGYGGTEAEWIEELGAIDKKDLEIIKKSVFERNWGFVWYADTDSVRDKNGKIYGTLESCMTDSFRGAWFYVRSASSESGVVNYAEKYTIDGANGYLSIRDYVVWTGDRLAHIPTFEAKGSTRKNSDGKYSPKSGVDGLMSSTDKAYLTDLINSFWGKDSVPYYKKPDPNDGWMVNWCRDDGIYLGGFKKDCGGHPPVLNNNHTSWVLFVFNGMATDTDLNRNHRVQIAFDVANSKIYMRRGWISSNEWAKEWSEVGCGGDVLFVNGSGDVALDENVKEVVFYGKVNADVLYPKNAWIGWRCVLNFANADEIEQIDVGTYDKVMFGFDGGIGNIQPGKSFMVVKTAMNEPAPPSNYTLYEIDNVTREKVE